MRGHPGYTALVQRRIFQLRQTARRDTQVLRSKWIDKLDDLFTLATSIAKGKVAFQRVGGKEEPITPKQRQMWARIAAYIAQIMNTIANGIDKRQL